MSTGNDLIGLADVEDVTPAGPDFEVLAAAVTAKQGVTALRITVALSAAVTFALRLTGGATAKTLTLNGGAALAVDALHTFVVGWRSRYAINFRLGGAAIVKVLLVEEIRGGVI